MTDVFISYKRDERERCRRIAEKLQALGLTVWFDSKIDAGVDFMKEVDQHVETCKAALVLWSTASVKSDWVISEATAAKNAQKLVSVKIEPCKTPTYFTTTNNIDLFNSNFSDYDEPWLRVVGRIGKLADRPGLALLLGAVEQRQRGNRTLGVGTVAALVAAGLAGAGGYAYGLSQAAPVQVPVVQTALPSPTPIEGAMKLLGRWRAEPEDPTCASPLEFTLYEDGLHVNSAKYELRGLAGQSLTVVDGTGAETVFETTSGGVNWTFGGEITRLVRCSKKS